MSNSFAKRFTPRLFSFAKKDPMTLLPGARNGCCGAVDEAKATMYLC